jgi:small GTP-binding protein
MNLFCSSKSVLFIGKGKKKTMDTNIKVVIVGSAGCGKTQLMMQYCENQFDENPMTTIGVEYKSKFLNIEGREIRVQLWDTAGQERFRAISRSIYHGARGMVIVYDITKKNTFDQVPSWLEEVRTLLPRETPIILIGNKTDLEDLREVNGDQADKLAKEHGLVFFETSAKTRSNVDQAFEWLARHIFEQAKQIAAQQAAIDAANASSSSNNSNRVSSNRVGAPTQEQNSNKVDLSKPAETKDSKSSGGKCSKC